jgi:hypothetical protein
VLSLTSSWVGEPQLKKFIFKQEGIQMIIVKTPQVVQNAVENFIGRHFRNASQRKTCDELSYGLACQRQ